MVLGMSFDTPEENAAFAAKFSFPFRLLSDDDRSVAVRYGAAASTGAGHPDRVTFVVDDTGTVAAVFPEVDVRTHAADVLAVL